MKLNFAVLAVTGAVLIGTPVFAAPTCVDSEGEAVIMRDDLPSARAEAVARAKWAAIEQVVGVQVKAQSVVQNMALVDDAVSKEIRGIVSGFKVLSEENRGSSLAVKINACVEPTKAQDALSSLALNNSIAVFLPAKKPEVIAERNQRTRTGERTQVLARDVQEETNQLSETVIGKLAEQGFTVVDVAPSQAVDAAEIEQAMKSGNYMVLRSLMYKFLSNMMLIGKVDYTISTRKGQDIGYGVSMPFNNVTVRLTYRLVTRGAGGRNVILAAGTEEARGMATNVEDATQKGLKTLGEKFAPKVLDKVSEYIKGIAKKVRVRVAGVNEVSGTLEVKDSLQNIAWVTNVEEKGISDGAAEFIVSYPENPIYLANSIAQKGGFHIDSFSTYQINTSYQK
ncbi:hypothetical protein [Geomesophilobacter sediminis]|uniref:Flagellar assembly protein T N-terminal domain-containing protein n=1 Tax=Geomesophilobacter sediminis TaxID=2798584 RepID=A0A8J7JBC9_9BACT|nr:hypothetical protein [Geomesophilobacter sediminis]MBJ6723863.1 hypothetical protein [Geomesophilobacter sediminis]